MTIVICKLKRKGGTKVEKLFGKTYHFKPESGDGTDPDILHKCDIPDEDAAALYRLLSIKDAYELEDPNAELPPRPRAEAGKANTIGNEKAVEGEIKPIMIKNGEDGAEINLATLSPEELRVLARDTFGISVHAKWKDAVVIQKIIEKTRGE